MSELEALYPFLYADTSDLSAVLAQVRASTVAKAEEILELRRTVCASDGARRDDLSKHHRARCATERAQQRSAHVLGHLPLKFNSLALGFV